eukprot:403345590
MGVNLSVFYGFIATGTILMITSAIGCLASDSKHEIITFIYGYISMCIMMIFFALAIATVILKRSFMSEMNKNCLATSGMVYDMDQIYQKGDSVLCSSSCPCKADAQLWPENQRFGIVHSEGTTDSLDDCPFSGLESKSSQKYVKLLSALENQFSCAGFCYSPKFFLFSDVTRGPPNNDCKDELNKVIVENGNQLAGILFMVGFTALIGFGISFAIVYSKKEPRLLSAKGYQPLKTR